GEEEGAGRAGKGEEEKDVAASAASYSSLSCVRSRSFLDPHSFLSFLSHSHTPSFSFSLLSSHSRSSSSLLRHFFLLVLLLFLLFSLHLIIFLFFLLFSFLHLIFFILLFLLFSFS